MNKDEECKEIYAYFGLAIYQAQCVEQSIIQLITVLDFFEEKANNITTKEKWVEDYDRFIDEQTKKTMGWLISHLKKLNYIDENTENNLIDVLKKRNWLAHSYFPDRALEFLSKKGRHRMKGELEECIELFKNIQSLLNPITYSLMKKYDLTESALTNIEEDLKKSASCDLNFP